MKGTYNLDCSFKIEFDVSQFVKENDKKFQEQKYNEYHEKEKKLPLEDTLKVDYQKCDGMPVLETMEMLHATSFTLLATNDLIKISREQTRKINDTFVNKQEVSNYIPILKNIRKPEKKDAVSFDKLIAEHIKENYDCMGNLEKALALAFLEKYVYSYSEIATKIILKI